MKKNQLKICVVTGSRAEYGLLLPLLKLIRDDASLVMQIIVTGMHLSPEFGLTYREIEKDGFPINEKIEMLLSGDTDVSIAKSTGIGVIGFAEAFERLRPDWIILLGDRFETFSAATSAHLLKIPIAHLHGGELTEGATDDAFRHAITKMAWLHFTSTNDYRQRVIQLGENPKRVFNTGAIGLDNIKSFSLLSKKELEYQLEFESIDKAVLVTYHPVTLEKKSAEQQINDLIAALDQFTSLRLIFTFPNADADGRVIKQLIENYVAKNPDRAKAFASLGQLKYLSLLKYVRAMVGNSSSGIIEAASFNLPVVNIGNRQDGRIKPESVIDSAASKKEIQHAIEKAFSETFRKKSKKIVNPYGNGNAAVKVLKQIKNIGKLDTTKKKFYDLKPE